jgi:hypothetical protein
LLLTFTRRAAEEMIRRAGAVVAAVFLRPNALLALPSKTLKTSKNVPFGCHDTRSKRRLGSWLRMLSSVPFRQELGAILARHRYQGRSGTAAGAGRCSSSVAAVPNGKTDSSRGKAAIGL